MGNVKGWLAARYKAAVPLALYGLSELAKHGFDLRTPTGLGAAIFAVLAVLGVHQVTNRQLDI